MALVKRKKIVIPYNGYIAPLKINGPVDVPYMETYENIAKLLMSKLPVYEVLNNGEKVKINLLNYDKKNSEDSENNSARSEYEKSYRKKDNKPTIVTDDDVKATSMANILANSTKRMPTRDRNTTNEQRSSSDGTPNKRYLNGGNNNSSGKHEKKTPVTEVIDEK